LPIVVATCISVFGGFKEIDKGKEVASMLIIHSIVKSSIVAIYISLSDCVLALTQNRNKDDGVLESAQQKRHHE
jgi:hypothetical protein